MRLISVDFTSLDENYEMQLNIAILDILHSNHFSLEMIF